MDIVSSKLWTGNFVNFRPLQEGKNSLSTRISGLNPSEVHHVFSILERRYFYALLWSNRIVDVKTQQLLPLENTQEIADRMGIRHPINPKTHELAQMSTDFVLDVVKNGVMYQAWGWTRLAVKL